MDLKAIKKAEYEIQLYGFCIENLKTDFKRGVLEIFRKNLKGIQEKLTKKENVKSTENTFQNEIDELYILTMRNIEKIYPHLEEVLEKYLSIPSNVLLPENEPYPTDQELETMEETIAALEKRAIRAKIMIAENKMELEMFENMDKRLENLRMLNISDFSFNTTGGTKVTTSVLALRKFSQNCLKSYCDK